MIVGAAVVEIHVHASQSLKGKRGVVQSIRQRVQQRFRVSVAEVGGQGLWQRAQLGIALVGIDPAQVRKRLERVLDFVEDLHLAEVVGSDIEILELPHEDAGGMAAWDEAEGDSEEPEALEESEEGEP